MKCRLFVCIVFTVENVKKHSKINGENERFELEKSRSVYHRGAETLRPRANNNILHRDLCARLTSALAPK